MSNWRNLALWIVIAILLVYLFNLFQGTGTHPQPSAISYSKFTEQVVGGQVRSVTFQGDQARGELSSGQQFATTVPPNDPSLWPTLKDHKVDTKVLPPDESPWFLTLLLNGFPIILMVGFWIFILR